MLYCPKNLSFEEKSVEFPPDFITNFREPTPHYSMIGLNLLKKLDLVLKETLQIEDRTFLNNCVIDEILPILFCYEFEDQYICGIEKRGFRDYSERRIFYNNLEKENPDLHKVVSHNKYRKRRIESVLRYAKHFGTSNQTTQVRSFVENLYDIDNPYKFQTEDWNFKHRIAEAVCELTVELTNEILLDVRRKIAA